MYAMYYAPMFQCWQLVRILVRTNHPCLRVGHHSSNHMYSNNMIGLMQCSIKQSNISYIMTHRSEKDYINIAETLYSNSDGEACLTIIFRILRKLLTPILESI
jgi:hypothetical protein